MFKISILTATYNRANLLPNLYSSIVDNLEKNIEIEWLIMDDGSNDETQQVIEKFDQFDNLQIKYYFQENKRKNGGIK